MAALHYFHFNYLGTDPAGLGSTYVSGKVSGTSRNFRPNALKFEGIMLKIWN